MKNIYLLVPFIVLCFCVVPQSSHAYFTTEQTAVTLDNTHALFVIEYTFGLKNEDMFMPAIAERDLSFKEADVQKVGYSIPIDGGTNATIGNTTAIVVSHAPIVNGMYKLEKGKAQKIWLIALLTTDSNELETDYALSVEKLPFYVDVGEKELQSRQLNPSELQYYKTKEVELNTGNYPKR